LSLSLSFFSQVFHLSNHNHNTCNYIRQCIVSTANTIPPLPAHKIIAGVFKKLGIIEQWGNGLKIISEDLKNYPEIEFKWSEPGIAFRVTFLKKNYEEDITPNTTLKTTSKTTLKLINILKQNPSASKAEITEILGNIIKDGVKYHLNKLKKEGKIKHIGPARGGHWEVID